MKSEDIQSEIVKHRLKQLQTLKKRKRGAFNSKLMRHAALIFLLKDQHEASFSDVAIYLKRYHRLKVTPQNIGHFYRKIAKESLLAQESATENYWGQAGSS